MPALFFAGLGVIALGGMAPVAFGRRARLGAMTFAALVVSGCLLVAIPAIAVLTGGGAWEVHLAAGVPGGAWVLGLDALSAFFLIAITVVGAASAVYGCGYLAAEPRRGAVSFTHAGVAVLLASLALVVTARAAIPFLIAWEVMAVTGFLLVMFDHDHDEARRAGLIYLAATHTATLALVALFAVWGGSARDLSFASLARAASGDGFARDAVLLLALLGFGLKAGLVPLHFWLPRAHAASPSHVSALMSGLVIKTGIYGLLRVAALVGVLPEWYGWSLLALGLLSGVLGVVWALAQHDLKRLLAYHSVENIGIMLIGMGIGALGSVYGLPALAALGYAGAALHVLNHALFKGLLFLAAGSIARATGTRNLDSLGGLARLMPVTGLVFLLASVAIIGLPPLNGFVSEWTIVRSLLQAGLGTGAIRAAIFGVAGLGLIGGLALACFAKVNGAVFLGLPRTPGAAAARESGPLMLGSMLALALGCVLIGILPALILPAALAAAAVIAGPAASHAAAAGRDVAWLSMTAAGLAAAVSLAWLARWMLMRGRSRSVARTWGCGYPLPTSRMQYTASSFAAPVLELFGKAAGIRTSQTDAAFHTHPFDPGLDGVLLPAWRRLRGLAGWLRSAGSVRLHVALLYVFATVVALLCYLALRQGK